MGGRTVWNNIPAHSYRPSRFLHRNNKLRRGGRDPSGAVQRSTFRYPQALLDIFLLFFVFLVFVISFTLVESMTINIRVITSIIGTTSTMYMEIERQEEKSRHDLSWVYQPAQFRAGLIDLQGDWLWTFKVNQACPKLGWYIRSAQTWARLFFLSLNFYVHLVDVVPIILVITFIFYYHRLD
jgi:hypothetical protein